MSPPPTHAWRYCVNLAVRDLRHDWKTTLVLVLALASILAPLLMMLGLKIGVIAALRSELLKDPRNLEIIVYGNFQLDQAFFRSLRGRDDVAFVIPKTRTINATLDLVNDRRQVMPGVEIVPTGAGDPLVPATLPAPAEPNQVLVTETVAERLGLKTSDPLLGVMRRRLDHRSEVAEIPLEIIGVIPRARYGRDAIFATLELLIAGEDYRDGFQAPLLNALTGEPPPPRTEFANARIYAGNLDAVANIAAWVSTAGVEVRTRADRIEGVKAIDRVLSFVFFVIASIGSLGGALALGGALWVNVDRKRRDLALLQLFGFSDGNVMVVPVVQSLAIAVLAFGLGYAAYLGGAAAFNEILGANLADRGYVCRLFLADVLAAAGVTALVSLLAGSAGGYRAHTIDPAESLREA